MSLNTKASAIAISRPQHTSKMGYSFSSDDDTWRLDNSVSVNFNSLPPLESSVLLGFKETLCRFAVEMSAKYTQNIFNLFKYMMSSTHSIEINLKTITKFSSLLNSETEYKLGYLKSFLLSWHEYGYDGISQEVVDFLEKSVIKGNTKGRAVATKCPFTGAYTPNEQRALHDWCVNAFTQNHLTLEEFSLFIALLYTGRRSTQIRYLRIKDLEKKQKIFNGNEITSYTLNIPRLKQRGAGFRELFTQVEINEELFELLSALSQDSIKTMEKHLGHSIEQAVSDELPIYFNIQKLSKNVDLDSLIHNLKNDYFHQTTEQFSLLIRKICHLNKAISERTNDFIHITSRRLRYTKGTNLARQGISGVTLAKALDHSDTQSISHYVENTAEMAAKINEMIAPALAPLAQAFSGTLIDSEKNALRANDPHSRIKNNTSNIVGNCGTHSFCASGYRSCYTCINFQPWLHGPHEEVRQELLLEREQQQVCGVSELIIEATDRLLLAIEQVIHMCQQKNGISNGNE